MSGYQFVMLVIAAFGALIFSAPFEGKPRWVNWIGFAWVVVWAAPPLVTIWIKGAFS